MLNFIWILFILDGVENTAKEGVLLIKAIHKAMQKYKHEIKAKLPKLYSQDLLNNLFKYPYTKIEFIVNDLKVSRITAANYLNKLAEDGLLKKERIGTGNYYVNEPLFNQIRTIDKLGYIVKCMPKYIKKNSIISILTN